jgi:hypothetical protein
MSLHSISMKLLCTAGLVGLLAAAPGVRTGSAQSMNDMARTLNNVLNPGDAQRLEDQARRNSRPQEERYWRDYRAGLDAPDRNRRPDYRERGDYRNPRDEGFQGDSGYRREYPDQRDYRYDRR